MITFCSGADNIFPVFGNSLLSDSLPLYDYFKEGNCDEIKDLYE